MDKEPSTSYPPLGAPNMTKNCRIMSNDSGYLPWKNENDVISYETLLLWERIVTGMLVPLVTVFGFTTNMVNCAVFYKHDLRHRIYFLLFSHSCADLAFDAYLFIYYCDRFYLQFIGQYSNHGPLGIFLTNSGWHTLYGIIYASGFLSTLIATERCLCVVKPLKAEWFFKTKYMCVIVCAVSILLVCAHYIPTERYKILCVYDAASSELFYNYFPSNFYAHNRLVVNVFAGAVYGFGLPFIFISVTIVTTIITAAHLKSSIEWREEAGKGQTTLKEVNVTKMLIGISCLFVTLKFPDMLFRITPMIVPDFRVGGQFQNIFMASLYTMSLTSALNSSLNIFIYFKMGSKYRHTLVKLCGQVRFC